MAPRTVTPRTSEPTPETKPHSRPRRRRHCIILSQGLLALFASCGLVQDAAPTPRIGDAAVLDAAADASVPCTATPLYQPYSLEFEGPNASEDSQSPNPFTDVRLTVVFEGPNDERIEVPGFFAGDGHGGSTGNIYRAHFAPRQPGRWRWHASMVTGDGVNIDEAEGTSQRLSNPTGTFCADAPEATTGFYRHGFIAHRGSHYLLHDDGRVWLKTGTNSPENLLAYADFDNTMDLPGGAGTQGLQDGLHRYEPHVGDWHPGDPEWSGGRGHGLIGALNYLAASGVNSIYFLPCNLGGDGRDTHPYIFPGDLLHFDISKLEQWDIAFTHAADLGIALHFVLNETEEGNQQLHDNGTLGRTRRLFYRELVARFAHHPGLFWNIGEESTFGAARHRRFAEHLREIDPYDHPISVHTNIDRDREQYDPLLGDPNFENTSLQLTIDNIGEVTERWRRQSAASGNPWVVMLDEVDPGATDRNTAAMRQKVLWPGFLSGAGGVEWYFGYHSLPLGGDLRTENFRTREALWRQSRIARDMLSELPVASMSPRDDLLRAAGEVFAIEGELYVLYLPHGQGTLVLPEAPARYSLEYLDPRRGTRRHAEAVAASTVNLVSPTEFHGTDGSRDVVAILRRQ